MSVLKDFYPHFSNRGGTFVHVLSPASVVRHDKATRDPYFLSTAALRMFFTSLHLVCWTVESSWGTVFDLAHPDDTAFGKRK